MTKKPLPTAFEVEVPLDSSEPILIQEHARVLSFAVVTRENQSALTNTWDAPGVYVLLGRIGHGKINGKHINENEWIAYVGQATSLRSRLRSHNKGKQFWNTALLVRRSSGRALHRGHIAWLEHALHERLTELPGVHLENNNTPPTDQGLSLSEERMTEEIAESTLQALALLGYRGTTTHPLVPSPGTRGTRSANTAHLSPPTTDPDRHSESNNPKGKRVSRKPSVNIIQENNALQHGEKLHLKPGSLNQHIREAVLTWANQNPDRLTATWNTTGHPLTWQADGRTYTPTGLVQHIIAEATGQTGIPVNGALWWVASNGETLNEIANQYA